ncbi:hypothetical protein DFQ28_004315 [Apophysomyces sp. BC1034]|nr:hypothetical protein DFQ30_004364 [Apophysomyces sp. BC1015]KAG0178414.1 hypothetical protein DFQ29_003485 [Apophysomyces sp. BC1021]KAG0188822.1 hypothetical protein DFQ28_004315 [Apophysomyces sp. BC1034]
MLKQAASKMARPRSTFFRVSQKIPTMEHAREVVRALRSQGELVEYKFMRCPETRQYLRYGFVVYKQPENAEKVLEQRFIKVPPGIFKTACEVKVETAGSRS